MSDDEGRLNGAPPTHPDAEQDKDGRWRLPDGTPLPVSASDLERYTYCPMSWYLAAQGVSGQSLAIEKGLEQHQAIHESMMSLKGHQFEAKRNLLIWQWWYAVIVVLLIDTLAIQYIDDINLNVMEFAKFGRRCPFVSRGWHRSVAGALAESHRPQATVSSRPERRG